MKDDLISRSALLEKRCRVVGYLDHSGYGSKVVAIPLDVIKGAPSIDAVEVVRCKDCKHFDTADFDGDPLYGCTLESAMLDIAPDRFCSYGERKEGAE